MADQPRPDDGPPRDPSKADSPEAARRRAEMPLPQNMQTLLLLGIFGLMILCTLYFTAEIVLPIVFAAVLYLLLQPAMRLFSHCHVPRTIAAILIILVFFGGVIALGFSLSGPAAEWAAKAPESLPRLEARLSILKKPVAAMRQASKAVEKVTSAGPTDVPPVAVTVDGPGLGSFLFNGTRAVLAGVLTTAVLLFFLLRSGDLFLRRLVEILPTLANKKQAVDISHEIQTNISSYLATISLMNAGVGIATGLTSWACGLSDPVLWGAVAFLLNYVPIIGPSVGVAVLFLVGLLTFDTIWQALLPAGLYLAIHVVEGETVTPILLARHFTLNPVLVIVSLLFWYWMWGVAGALLAVPMLATFKIICDRVTPLMAFGHFLGTEPRS